MHKVSKIDASTAQTPATYAGHNSGFQRATYVDHSTGSVHMGTGICYLAAGGSIDPHVQAFEESFIILEGSLVLQHGDQAFRLEQGHYGLIRTGTPHAWRNTSDQPARWLEMQSPQPRPTDYAQDTFFVDGTAPNEGTVPVLSAEGSPIGFFDETQLPRPGGPSQMEGFNPTTGVTIKMFVDRSFGAIHQSLFLIQYEPGAKIDLHDHTFEESYLILSGEVEAECDGTVYRLGPGDVVWTSVGGLHRFSNVGDVPVRWLETQAPLPPAEEVFRFERDWAQYGRNP